MMRALLVGLVMPTATIAIFHVSTPVPLFESAVARPSGVASLKRGVELERRGARILEADSNNNNNERIDPPHVCDPRDRLDHPSQSQQRVADAALAEDEGDEPGRCVDRRALEPCTLFARASDGCSAITSPDRLVAGRSPTRKMTPKMKAATP